MKPLITILAAIACCASLSARSASAATPVLTVTTSGTIVSFSNQSQLLNLNTAIGVRTFLLNTSTLILVNNHTGAATNLTAGLKAKVTYNYANFTATIIHVFNENKLTAKVNTVTGAIGANTISVKVNGAVVNLKTDANSVVHLESIPLADPKVLVGLKVQVVFEPGTLLILSLNGSSETVTGPITAIDSAAKKITVGGKHPITVVLDAAATIRGADVVVPITSLVVGDMARIAFVRDTSTSFRALAVNIASAP